MIRLAPVAGLWLAAPPRPAQGAPAASPLSAGWGDRFADSVQRARQWRDVLLWLLGALGLAATGIVAWSVAMRRAIAAARRDLERSQAALMESQKLEAIGRMTGGVAHDFNNLLQILSSGLMLLERDTIDTARREQVRASMRRSLERGKRITQQLLAFARRQPLQPERLDLHRHVLGLADLLRQSLRADIELRLEFPDGLWPVEVDPTQLEVALLNLAVNARDAMPRGGRLVIGAGNVSLDESGPAGERLRGEYVQLRVADTGTGMTPHVLARVFEPFFTTKAVGQATGLGLPQVFGFARQSGGTARAASRAGEGTTISIYLPRAAVAPDSVKQPPSPAQPAAPSGLLVLLVEEDPDLAARAQHILRDLGHSVQHCATPTEAMCVLESGMLPDLVVTDVLLPRSFGPGVHQPQLPVVLATGLDDVARVTATGLPVLRKPFTLEELRAALAQAVV